MAKSLSDLIVDSASVGPKRHDPPLATEGWKGAVNKYGKMFGGDYLGSLIEGAKSGMLMGGDLKAIAAVDAIKAKLGGDNRDFDHLYQENLDIRKKESQDIKDKNPITTTVGDVGGFIAGPGKLISGAGKLIRVLPKGAEAIEAFKGVAPAEALQPVVNEVGGTLLPALPELAAKEAIPAASKAAQIAANVANAGSRVGAAGAVGTVEGLSRAPEGEKEGAATSSGLVGAAMQAGTELLPGAGKILSKVTHQLPWWATMASDLLKGDATHYAATAGKFALEKFSQVANKYPEQYRLFMQGTEGPLMEKFATDEDLIKGVNQFVDPSVAQYYQDKTTVKQHNPDADIKPVTDPDLLNQLEAAPNTQPALTPVTDPDILKQLNSQ